MNGFFDEAKKQPGPRRSDRLGLSARLQTLIQRNNQYYTELSKNADAVRAYKRSLLTDQLKEEADRKIFGHFHQEGGILFFAGILKQYVEHLLKEDTSVEEMWIGGYNSAISRMQYKLEKMTDCYTRCGLELEKAEAAYADKAELLQSIGYQSYTPAVKAMQGILTDRQISGEEFNRKAPLLMEKLTHITEKNRQAAETARRLGKGPHTPYQMKHLILLRAANEVLSDERAARLSTPEGWERAAYAETLKEFEAFVAQKLTEPFALRDADTE